MTKKHFKALAEALQFERPAPTWSKNKHVQWNCDMLAVAKVCEQFNARFDFEKFVEACGGRL